MRLKFLKDIRKVIAKKPNLTGFASIRKPERDAIDSSLEPKEPTTGFATIHRKDKSGDQIKEDHVDPVVTGAHYHQAYMNHSDEKSEQHFAHHTALNDRYQKHVDKNLTNMKPAREQLPYDSTLKHTPGNSAIRRYTDQSRHLNTKLITGEHNKNHSEHLVRRLDKDHKEISRQTSHPANAFKHNTILHSGVSLKMSEKLKDLKHGDTVHMPAYTSTSTDRKTARGFATMGDYKPEAHMIHFHIQKGYHHGRFVKSLSSLSQENEVVLHHGTTWRKVGYHHTPAREEDGAFFGKINHPAEHHHHFIPA